MANTVTEQIVREAPDIEAYKVGLLQSAKALADKPLNLPGYQVAGFSPDQTQAFDMARQGIGAYKPYIDSANQSITQGTGVVREGADVLRGADTRGQFTGAQNAMNLAGGAAGQMTGAANQINPAYGMLQQAQQYAIGSDTRGMMPPAYQAVNQGLNAAQRGIGQLMSSTGQYNPNQVAAYMNPYQQQVINSAMQEMNRQRDINAQNIKGQATRAGAYGGSREAIMQSELNRNNTQLQDQYIAQLMNQGYTQAQAQSQSAFEQAQQRGMAAGTGLGNIAGTQGTLGTNLGNLATQQASIGQNISNALTQQAGQQGNLANQQANIYNQQGNLYNTVGQGIGNLATQQFGIGRDMALGMGTLGTQMGNLGVQQGALGQTAQQLSQNDVNMLYNVGQTQQAQNQSVLDAERNTALQNEMAPYQQIGFLSDVYKGAPSSQSSITAASAPTPSALTQAAGLAIAGTAAATGAKKAGLF